MRVLFTILSFLLFTNCACQKTTTETMKTSEKVLRINISREPTTLDPRKIFDPSHHAVAAMLFEGLIKLDSNLTVRFAQADSVEISSDRLVYTFHLASRKWSNGTEVTAVDFEKTFLDLLNPNFPAPHAHLLYDIKNAQECKLGTLPLSNAGIRSLDNKTLQITLKHPNPSFLQILANSSLVPICHANEEANPNWADQAGPCFVCNGPFVLNSWDRHVELVLKSNPHYSSGARAKINEVHITMIDNEASALHMYASGYLDIIGTPFSQIPLSYIKDLKEKKLLTIQPVAASLYCSFNTSAFPFNNTNLRKAFSTAINRREIIEHITMLGDEPALSAVPSILKKNRSKTWIQDGNSEEARRYFNQALSELNISAADLKGITLYYWPFELNYRISQTIQQQWLQNLGVKVNIEVIDFKSLLTKVADGSYQLAIFAWGAEYADPLSLLQQLRLPNDAKNYCRWHCTRFNALLDESALESDPDKRLDILEKAEDILMQDMPFAPIFHWNFPLLIQDRVSGFSIDPLGIIHLENVSLLD